MLPPLRVVPEGVPDVPPVVPNVLPLLLSVPPLAAPEPELLLAPLEPPGAVVDGGDEGEAGDEGDVWP
jgi:hypothetical protein